MNKIISSFLIVITVVLCVLLMPRAMSAAELTFEIVPNTKVEDNVIIIDVRVDPQSKKLNVIEGTILFSGILSDDMLVQIENGQSILSLWPTLPKYIKNEKAIHFTGGIPGGFDKEGLLFRLRLSSATSGDLTMSFINGISYLNDGKGTTEKISSQPLTINSNQFGSSEIVKNNFLYNKFVGVIILLIVGVILFFYVYKKIIKK